MGMIKQPANIVSRNLTQICITLFFIIKQFLLILPDALVCVHAAAIISKQRFGHECDDFASVMRNITHDILELKNVVCLANKRIILDVNLGLSSSRNFMVLSFNFNARGLQRKCHLITNILLAINRRNWKITFLMSWSISSI